MTQIRVSRPLYACARSRQRTLRGKVRHEPRRTSHAAVFASMQTADQRREKVPSIDGLSAGAKRLENNEPRHSGREAHPASTTPEIYVSLKPVRLPL